MNIIVFCILLLTDSAYVFDFLHVLDDGNTSDSARGQIYRIENDFYINVKEPVEQVIYFEGDTMIVYYPYYREAFKIKSGITFKFQTPGGPAGKVGTNLKKAGFVFIKRESNGQRRVETWSHPKAKIKVIYTYEKNNLVSMQTIGEKGDTLLVATYGDFINFENKEIPMLLKVTSGSTKEMYKLSNPRKVLFDDALMGSLRVPTDAKITLKGFEE